MSKHNFHNTGRLARLILRQDRIRLPIWLISLVSITVIVAISFAGLYSTDLERQIIAETMLNPAMTAMVGIGYGLDNYTTGAMMAHQMLLMTALAVGIMNILLVTRHTRAEEEDGRVELVQSLPTGRLSNLNATIVLMLGTNGLLALLTGFGLYALNIESMGVTGSMLYGAALGATGFIFATITAVFAQLSESSRGTIGLSISFLLFAYLIRAVGDVSYKPLSWFSPFGWVLGSEVYVNNYWWPIGLTFGVALLFAMLAYYLNAIRDLEAGFLPSRSGRRHASPLLKSTFGLSWRLQRTALISWAIGMFVLGASYGSVLGDLESFFEGNDMMKEMLVSVDGYTLTEQFITMLMSVIAMICAVPMLMAVLKLRGEEKRNRLDSLLSRPVSRTRLLVSYLTLSVISGLIMLSVAALGLATAGLAVIEDGLAFSTFFSAALAYMPAMLVMIGCAVMLIGVSPKYTGLTWLYLTYSFFVVYLGGLLQFPEWMGKLSPFGHISKLPIESFDITKAILLVVIAVVITIVGIVGYNKRDIQG